MKLVTPYLMLAVIVWLPWGMLCIFNVQLIETIIGVTSTSVDGTSDIRAMYGGAQTGVGLMAAFALYNRTYVTEALFALAFLGTSMAFARSYGLIVDGSWTFYTSSIAVYEAFTGLSAIILLKSFKR
ncbi:MAG: DUF4345 family protein [Hyphomonadaceae bacterium]